MAVIGGGATLVVRVVVLRAGNGRERSAVVLKVLDVEGAVADVLRGTLLIAVMAGAQLFRLDVRRSRLVLVPGAACPQWGQGVLLTALGAPALGLPHPAVTSGAACCLIDRGADAVAARVGRVGDRHARVPVRRQVLVELVDVERLDVRDDVAAQLSNVHVAEVDVELPSRAFLERPGFALQIPFAWLHISFRGGGGSGRPLRLTCFEAAEEGRGRGERRGERVNYRTHMTQQQERKEKKRHGPQLKLKNQQLPSLLPPVLE